MLHIQKDVKEQKAISTLPTLFSMTLGHKLAIMSTPEAIKAAKLDDSSLNYSTTLIKLNVKPWRAT